MARTELEQLLRATIEAEGPLPFDRYMEMALYEPGLGYYARGPERSDWTGDFITAPQLDPAYGELWAAGIEQLWRAAGEPASFGVIEIGPGEGGFARSVLDALPGDGRFHYTLVERLPALAARQRELLRSQERVEWVSDLAAAPKLPHGVVIANEVLDNLPVKLVTRTPDGLREKHVIVEDGALGFAEVPPGNATVRCMSRSDLAPIEGGCVEVPVRTEAFVRGALAHVETGAALFIDYGAEGRILSERPAGTLACYSPRGLDDDPLQEPGSKDITAHANWSLVRRAIEDEGATALGPLPQSEVLRSLGLGTIDGRLRGEYDDALAAGRGADAVRALSRRQALGALTARGGLGGFEVMAALKGVEPPPFLAPEMPEGR
ncbi:MAG: class I SAM-dependent methyltransferase [Actinomycetota bacterium]